MGYQKGFVAILLYIVLLGLIIGISFYVKYSHPEWISKVNLAKGSDQSPVNAIPSQEKYHLGRITIDYKKLGTILNNNELKQPPVIFSGDANRFAYEIYDSSKNQYLGILDGQVLKQKEGGKDASLIYGSFVFSPDSKRTAYIEYVNASYRAVIDNEPGSLYSGADSIVFSPDSRRIAYTAGDGKNSFVVVDGTEGKSYLKISSKVIFSPDSQHVAYKALTDRNAEVTVVDGREEQKSKATFTDPIFSPDSKSVIYNIADGTDAYIVVNGQKQTKYSVARYPVISQDSKHLAYVASKSYQESKSFVVKDGQAQEENDGVGYSINFSPNSQKMAYDVRNQDSIYTIIGGEKSRAYPLNEASGGKNFISHLSFSPDSKIAAYMVGSKDKVLVINSKETRLDFSPVRMFFSSDSSKMVFVNRSSPGEKEEVRIFHINPDYSLSQMPISTPLLFDQLSGDWEPLPTANTLPFVQVGDAMVFGVVKDRDIFTATLKVE